MNRTAYLIAHMGVKTRQIKSVGIYSDPPLMLTTNLRDERLMVITEESGSSYDAARSKLIMELATVNPYTQEGFHDWAFPIMHVNDLQDILDVRRGQS